MEGPDSSELHELAHWVLLGRTLKAWGATEDGTRFSLVDDDLSRRAIHNATTHEINALAVGELVCDKVRLNIDVNDVRDQVFNSLRLSYDYGDQRQEAPTRDALFCRVMAAKRLKTIQKLAKRLIRYISVEYGLTPTT